MADGLIEDCRNLLSRFESRGSVRFEIFTEVWKEMNFSFIHCGRRDTSGRMQMTEYLYRVICSYLSSSCTFIYRVGALYALYAAFNTQLCQPKVKIRMTLPMWNNLKELQEQFQEMKHYDADFILRSLKNAKAFLFCAMTTQLAYGSREAITVKEGEKAAAVSAAADQVVDRSCGILERLHGIDTKYQNVKRSLQQLDDPDINKQSIDVASPNFTVDLASDIELFDKWKQDRCLKHVMNQKKSSILMMPDNNIVKDKPSEPAPRALTKSQARAKLLDDLKKKSFSQNITISRSRRYLLSTDDEGEESNGT